MKDNDGYRDILSEYAWYRKNVSNTCILSDHSQLSTFSQMYKEEYSFLRPLNPYLCIYNEQRKS
jgi:hypothetical protein